MGASAEQRRHLHVLQFEQRESVGRPGFEHIQEHAATTFVFANNDVGGKSVVNALELAEILGDERRMAPADLIAAFPHELAEFHSDRPLQDALFSSYEPDHRAVA